MHVANSMKFSKKMMKSHQLRHAILGKIKFCTFFIFKKIKNGKIFFAEGKHGKYIFALFLFSKKIRNGKNFLQKENMEKYIFALFLFKKKNKNGKIFFAEGKNGNIFFVHVFLFLTIKTGFFCHQSCLHGLGWGPLRNSG